MSWRLTVIEKDFSNFVTSDNNQIAGAMVISKKGPIRPVFCQSEEDIILYFGAPDASTWGIFEAIEYVKQAPIWISRAIGSGALYSGLDVRTNYLQGFGSETGRDINAINLSNVNINTKLTIGTGNGQNSTFITTILNKDVYPSSLKVYKGTTLLPLTYNSLTGAITDPSNLILDNLFTNQITLNNILLTATINLKFAGVAGTPAQFIGDIDLSSPIDLSLTAKEKAVSLQYDGAFIQNIIFGNSPTTLFADIRDAINDAVSSALGYTVTPVNSVLDSGTFIQIDGMLSDATRGKIIIGPPSDLTNYESGVKYIFDSNVLDPTLSTSATSVAVSPTGGIPIANQDIIVDFIYNDSIGSDVSHSFFHLSPCDESQTPYAMNVKWLQGKQYKAVLYVNSDNGFIQVKDYLYSLLDEKDNFNNSLYIKTVFKNDPYLIPVINESYLGVAVPADSIVSMSGGKLGAIPLLPDKAKAWNVFRQKNRYRVKTFLDFYGDGSHLVQDLLKNYQPYAFGITKIPRNLNAFDSVSYRQSLGINYDNMAIYSNWIRIEDEYNGGSLWVSGIGKVGVKYAQMNDTFDSLAPAGIDENNHGGLLAGFKILESEYDYTDAELEMLDNAQINPMIIDDIYGPMIYGDRTLKVSNSDTSFIGARRVYNYIIDNVITQVLRLQEFRFNDEPHRDLAKTLTEQIINPIVNQGFLAESLVICNTRNNTPEVLNQRRFVLTIVLKVFPTSERLTLNLIRVSQTQTVAQFA